MSVERLTAAINYSSMSSNINPKINEHAGLWVEQCVGVDIGGGGGGGGEGGRCERALQNMHYLCFQNSFGESLNSSLVSRKVLRELIALQE